MALYKDGNPVSGLNSVPRLTLAQYNALNVKPEFWVRTDAPESYKKLSADQVSYDSNTTVKDKIDNITVKRYRLTHTSFTWNESNKYFISNDKLTNIIGNELLLGITGNFTNGSAILGCRVNNQGYIIVMGWIPNLASVIDSGYQFELFILTKSST